MLDFNLIDPKAPLYYQVMLAPPDYKRKDKRFLKESDAILYVKKKTKLETYHSGGISGRDRIFSPSVSIYASLPLNWFVIEVQRHGIKSNIKTSILRFFSDKLFEIPGAPKDLIIELLAEPDAFTRDNMILAYKLKNPKLYPNLLS